MVGDDHQLNEHTVTNSLHYVNIGFEISLRVGYAAGIVGTMSILEDLRKAVTASVRDGSSITSIAEKADIHRVSLSRFMTGDRDLSVEAVEKLATALGIAFVAQPIGKSRRAK